MLAGVGERPLTLPRGVVVQLRRRLTVRECLLPKFRGGRRDIRRQAGVGVRVPGINRRLVLPKPLHCLRNRGGRSAFQFFPDLGDGGVAAGAHQMPGCGLDVGVGDARWPLPRKPSPRSSPTAALRLRNPPPFAAISRRSPAPIASPRSRTPTTMRTSSSRSRHVRIRLRSAGG